MSINKKLLLIHYWGFKDELRGELRPTDYFDKYEQKPYNLGRRDAIVGDEVTSVDYKTESEILKEIYVGAFMNTSSQRKLIKSRLEREIIGSVVVTCDESNNDPLTVDMNKLVARVTWSEYIGNKYVDLVFG